MLILEDYLIVIAAIVVPMITGVFSGMFGIGGGIFFVPITNIILKQYYPELNQSMLIANNTSLACIIFSSMTALWLRKHDIEWSKKDLLTRVITLVPGSFLGGWVVRAIENKTLNLIFGFSLITLAIYYFFRKEENTHENKLFLNKILPITFMPVSFTASLLGMSGAIFLFPLQLKAGYSKYKSAAKCSISTLIISTAATSWIFIDPIPEIPSPYFIGDIFWPMIITSILITPLTIKIGININKKLDEKKLLKTLSLLLLAISFIHFII